MPPQMIGCLPGGLHPMSRQFLDAWLSGRMSTDSFRRFFSLPNSDYLDVAQCLVNLMGIAS